MDNSDDSNRAEGECGQGGQSAVGSRHKNKKRNYEIKNYKMITASEYTKLKYLVNDAVFF